MITPSKFTTLDQSILAKTRFLFVDGCNEISLTDLKKMTIDKFTDIGEFMLALDVLFVLEKIEIDNEKGIVRYVD